MASSRDAIVRRPRRFARLPAVVNRADLGVSPVGRNDSSVLPAARAYGIGTPIARRRPPSPHRRCIFEWAAPGMVPAATRLRMSGRGHSARVGAPMTSVPATDPPGLGRCCAPALRAPLFFYPELGSTESSVYDTHGCCGTREVVGWAWGPHCPAALPVLLQLAQLGCLSASWLGLAEGDPPKRSCRCY